MPKSNAPEIRNILTAIEPVEHVASASESFLTLLQTEHLRLERIVSRGQATAAGQWLEQDLEEWVLVLKGRAALTFADGGHTIEMNPGDYVRIPARARHCVEWTDPHGETIWLALHYPGDES